MTNQSCETRPNNHSSQADVCDYHFLFFRGLSHKAAFVNLNLFQVLLSFENQRFRNNPLVNGRNNTFETAPNINSSQADVCDYHFLFFRGLSHKAAFVNLNLFQVLLSFENQRFRNNPLVNGRNNTFETAPNINSSQADVCDYHFPILVFRTRQALSLP
ncbi:hypothetical protein [Ignavibacterium sp.]|uniref:hypothetical protein n=1 Tax=Ignavibacterium sp. TaxID=2651167 RepID=UPI00307D0E50